MLPDGSAALTNPCLPESPWSKFPFTGFFAMMAALATLVVDFVGTQYYERRNEAAQATSDRVGPMDSVTESGIVRVERVDGAKDWNGKVFGEEEGGGMHIVGIHAHAAHHGHNHSRGQEACEGHAPAHSHGHSHGSGGGNEEEGAVRHVVVSQVN